MLSKSNRKYGCFTFNIAKKLEGSCLRHQLLHLSYHDNTWGVQIILFISYLIPYEKPTISRFYGQCRSHMFIMQMVSPYLKRINHFYQFQIMSGLVLLTRSKSISYDFPILHKHVIKPLIQSINIKNKDSRTIRDSEHWSNKKSILQLLKTFLTTI